MAKKKRKPVSNPATAPATVKQFACTADLLTTAKHYLGEINRPYVLIIEGIPDLLTNMPLPHARRILDDAAIFQDKLSEAEMDSAVEKISAIPPEEGGATGTGK